MNKPADLSRLKAHAQAGLSLVELMVSIAIGLLLMVIILQIFVGSNEAHRVTENQSRLQENGRYIMEEMSRDIRMAGYLGCSKNAKINLMVKGTAGSWATFNDPVHGYESVTSTMGLTSAEVLSGTDVIRIQRSSAADANVTGNLIADNANIKIDGNPDGFAADDTLVISDCASADIFCASNVSSGGGNITITHSSSCNDGTAPKLSKLYGPHSQVMRLSTNIYYIGTGAGGCKANMLCRKTLSGSNRVVEELIENVDNMQLEYGEDIDGDFNANRFLSAASISDWNNVVSVRLNLTLRSNEANLATTTQPYPDRRIRRLFSNTVTLRNRTL